MRAEQCLKTFVLNTRDPESAAAAVCIHGLARQLRSLGCTAVINDWNNYIDYDVAIFMASDVNCQAVRSIDSDVLIGIADPKPTTLTQAAQADFCIVSSIEQRDVFMCYNRNQFIHYMIPEFDSFIVNHKPKDVHRIFYHGNKVHLNGAFQGLIPALNELGKRYQIEFNAIYNIEKLGKWTFGRPNSHYCPTRDWQWYPNCYKDYFFTADIGVVQNLMPMRKQNVVRSIGSVSKSLFLESPLDHLTKFKSSANAGRAFVFGYFGVPVVADATPSMGDAIIDGYSGHLVLSAEGWFDALEDLILSPAQRNRLASNFRKEIDLRFSPGVSAERLLSFLKSFEKKEAVKVEAMYPSVLSEEVREKSKLIARRTRRMIGRE